MLVHWRCTAGSHTGSRSWRLRSVWLRLRHDNIREALLPTKGIVPLYFDAYGSEDHREKCMGSTRIPRVPPHPGSRPLSWVRHAHRARFSLLAHFFEVTQCDQSPWHAAYRQPHRALGPAEGQPVEKAGTRVDPPLKFVSGYGSGTSTITAIAGRLSIEGELVWTKVPLTRKRGAWSHAIAGLRPGQSRTEEG